MPVLSSSEGGRKSLSCCVNSLPDVHHVDSASDFFDKSRCDTFFTEVLVTAKEVNLSHHNRLALDGHVNGNSRNESIQVSFCLITDTNNPVREVTWRVEGPFQEISRVLKSEFTICIFDIMSLEKFVKFLKLVVVLKIDNTPFEAFR